MSRPEAVKGDLLLMAPTITAREQLSATRTSISSPINPERPLWRHWDAARRNFMVGYELLS